jgi:hypothetical protein
MSQPFRIKNDFEIAGDLTAESGARFGSAVVFDPDAVAYIQAVEAADGQQLELAVRFALDDFVKGCKSDGIWDAIKASCIMAGARTLGGALVPLRGTAPTNFNFVSSDYNRKTGLKGDGATKYLNSNRLDSADGNNNHHISGFAVEVISSSTVLGVRNVAPDPTANETSIAFSLASTSPFRSRLTTSSIPTREVQGNSGFVGLSRNTSSLFTIRFAGQNENLIAPSGSSLGVSFAIYARNTSAGPVFIGTGPYTFYSIGESLDLAALDTRVSALMTAINTAII